MNTTENTNNFSEKKKIKRPNLLTFLCIFTFIISGIGVFTNLMITSSYEEFMELISEESFDFPGAEYIKKASYGFFLLGTILHSLSLFGAAQMWKLRKIGFHFYLISQFLLIILPFLYIKGYPFPYLDILIASVFVYLYSRNLKFMK